MNAPPRAQRSHLERINDQLAAVLDPPARQCRGWPAERIRPILRRAWRAAFGCDLGEPALTETATAIRDGRPWSEALWTDGW